MTKARAISKVVLSLADSTGAPPDYVALAEVDNDYVLRQLVYQTALSAYGYRYVHFDSRDHRGIDCALLYRGERPRSRAVPLVLDADTLATRDILLCEFDSLTLMVCHLPSKRGGSQEAARRRVCALRTIDSLARICQGPLVVMGDFNDTPADRSIAQVLTSLTLQPLLDVTKAHSINGTHKYQGTWSQLDHLFVHPSMLDKSASMQLVETSPRLFAPAFLLKKETNGSGMRPFRTYMGYRYEGGFSDHLPILADFVIDAVIRESEDKEE